MNKMIYKIHALRFILLCLLALCNGVNAGTLTVNNGANFTGTGELAGDLVVNSGGNVAPSSACLSVENATFKTGGQLSITIEGTDNCVNYSQLQVNGVVDLSGANLDVVTNGYTLLVEDDFTILVNDNSDAITDVFDQLPENGSFTLDGNEMFMSYMVGDGNDAGFRFVFQYNVAGFVTGLAVGNSITIQNNGSDTMLINADTGFIFNNQDDGSNYAITISASDLTTPNQTCEITGGNSGNNNGTGTLAGSNDATIAINCTTVQYDLDVMVTGLDASNSIQLSTNSQTLNFTGAGMQSFAPIDDGSAYAVLLTAQPMSPNQECTITGGNGGANNGSGILVGGDVIITVTCTTNQYFVGGMASGLFNGNSVLLLLGAEDLSVNSNDAFVFINPLADESDYFVSVSTQPTIPNQTCKLVNPTGTIAGNDITDMEVNCTTNHYMVGGMVTGLHAGNNLVLQNNSGDDLTISSDGDFDFISTIEDLQSYNVTILNQPTNPIQPCATSNNSGNVSGDDIITVAIVCEFGDDLIYRDGFE